MKIQEIYVLLKLGLIEPLRLGYTHIIGSDPYVSIGGGLRQLRVCRMIALSSLVLALTSWIFFQNSDNYIYILAAALFSDGVIMASLLSLITLLDDVRSNSFVRDFRKLEELFDSHNLIALSRSESTLRAAAERKLRLQAGSVVGIEETCGTLSAEAEEQRQLFKYKHALLRKFNLVTASWDIYFEEKPEDRHQEGEPIPTQEPSPANMKTSSI